MRTRDWPALTLLTGIAVLTGSLAGRDRPTPEPTSTEPATPQPATTPDHPAAAVDMRPAMIGVCTLGLAAIAALTVTRPRRRQRHPT